ncbi:MAG: hypothetical protein IPM92_06285 [Saprospiraceae bacterium]|nr:hypothetical protein [Saprospiraceae bacterium]
MQSLKLIAGLSIILIMSRLVPHAPNFTATLASLIFSALIFRKYIFWLFLLFAYWVSDLALNNSLFLKTEFTWFTSGIEYLVIIYTLIYVLLVKFGKQMSAPIPVFVTSISCSVLFFIFSNLSVWMNSSLYSKDITGIMECYVAAIPFFGNEVAGTLFYCSIFFAAYWLMQPSLQTNEIKSGARS